MKILVIGGGGREHTLAWKLSQSPRVDQVFCAPGNAGTESCARNVEINPENIEGLLAFAQKEGIELTVVGPEAPLVGGIVDLFREKGLKIFGPTREAAALEGSKVFAKEFMSRNRIPVEEAMEKRVFGSAGDRVILEEILTGEEASYIGITDGKTVIPMASSQDHKAVFDGDRGPNTGGMGAYSPAPVMNEGLSARALAEAMEPVIRGMAAREGQKYQGALYAGLMIRGGEFWVLEYNCRFGDPETQPILFRLQSDLASLLLQAVEEDLKEAKVKWDPRPAVCVVLCSGGYPGGYAKGKEITGLEEAGQMEDVSVFHAGTRREGKKIVTAGGRVLGVTARGKDLRAAIDRAYQACARINFEGMRYRRDIGNKGLIRKAPMTKHQ
ncbi:MAG: phosphoribosylamine--glycine ligase [Proteobacteria bacterium]|nr:phosphoribosylamine--glycine ligase [Pseudomonadota bacterium]